MSDNAEEDRLLRQDAERPLKERLRLPVASSSKAPVLYRESTPFALVPEDPELITSLARTESVRRRQEQKELLTQAQRAEIEQAIFHQMEFESRMTPQHAYPYTVRVAWRVVLLWSWARGFLSQGKSLEECLGHPGAQSPCLWAIRDNWPAPSPGASKVAPLRRNPAPMLPAQSWASDWLDQLEVAARFLDLRRGPEHNIREGIWGLRFLQENPVACFPLPEHLFLWDSLLIEDVENLTSISISRAARYLKENYCLMPHEVNYLVAAALSRKVDRFSASTTAKTALMEDRLEAILEKPDLDNRTRLQTLRTLGVIQGLGQAKSEEDFLGELVSESERNDE